ncbi:IS110 family RNA-guided transposase [Tannockella kyphosi]|uniref:IS110 family transposase n=1 Tax=Tannockella kyphosi TaxID=2899121 RepID=UPI0020117A1F|nr:IS110 family transposase [Tannockella kyphosi]
MTYYVGIDIAKTTHYACVITTHGEVIHQPFPFDNSKEGFHLLLSKISSIDKEDILIGFESTAHYHQNLHSYLSTLGYHCELINPIISKQFRGLSVRNAKTDKIDAMSIAQLLSYQYNNSQGQDFLVSDLRVYCDERVRLTKQKTKLYIQLTAELDRVFPELKSFFKGNLKTNAAHNLLKRYATAKEIKEVRNEALTKLISKNSKGFNLERIKDLKSLSKNSVGFHSNAISFRIKNIILQIELLESQIEDVEANIIEMMKEIDSAILNIPGMGYIQGAYILSAIISIDRFDSPCKVLAYAGLDPIIRQSGNFNAKRTRMSKRGNATLRYALIWAAHNVAKNSTTMNTYYLKKRSEGKSHYNALGHCSKKLVNYIYFVLNNPDEKFILE